MQLCSVLFTVGEKGRTRGPPLQTSTMVLSPLQVEDEENKALLEEEDGHSSWQRFDATILRTSQTPAWRSIARRSILIEPFP